MTDIFSELGTTGGHRVMVLNHQESGLHAIIALDNLAMGPGCGGIRTQPYATTLDALTDVQKLASAMTLKCAISGVPAGGAKTVVIDHPGMDRAAAFTQLGRYIGDLGGLYRCAGDLGTTLEDLKNAASQTQYVDTTGARLGEATGITIVNCIRACADTLGGKALSELSVAVQGCGLIGAGVARLLAEAGAKVIVADVDDAKSAALAAEIGASALPAGDILTAEVDIVSPCAIGGVITHDVAQNVKAWAICGGANNQLASPDVIDILTERSIAFVPDYLASSGALIDGVSRTVSHVDQEPLLAAVYDTACDVLNRAKAEGRTTTAVAEEIAAERIAAAQSNE